MHKDTQQCNPVRVKTHRVRHMTWYKRCPADWQRGTRKHNMSFELRGFYSECLDAQWEMQGELPKDAKILAILLGTNARLVRALMPQLVALGKMTETSTGYSNDRMAEDIGQAPSDLEPASNQARTKRESSTKIEKKPAITTRDLEKEKEKEKEIERKEELASCAAREEKSVDVTAEMVESIIGWAPGMNQTEARQWLVSSARIYGQDPLRASYHKLKTDLITGQIIGHPLRAWGAIAERLRAEAAAKTEAKSKPKQKSATTLAIESYMAKKAKAEAGKVAANG